MKIVLYYHGEAYRTACFSLLYINLKDSSCIQLNCAALE